MIYKRRILQLGTLNAKQKNILGKVINEYDLTDVDELLIGCNINSRDILNFLYPSISNQKYTSKTKKK